MRDSGFLKKFRFDGNFIANKKTRTLNGETFVDRRSDKGHDDLESLIITLFPSNLGIRLEAVDEKEEKKIGKRVQVLLGTNTEKGVKILAQLMVAAELSRLFVEKRGILSQINEKKLAYQVEANF
jgi:hypothetical protein